MGHLAVSPSVESRHAPPSPADITHLRASDGAAALVLSSATALTGAGILISWRGPVLLWAIGQGLLGLAEVQWFSLLHECGHETLFRSKWLNAPVGRVAAFFSLIPFLVWKRVHARHHKWTGWQDVDPTTQTLVPRDLKSAEGGLVKACWGYWFPLFSV